MGLSSAIEAGRAVVRVFSDDSALARGLQKSKDRLDRFAARTAQIGATLFGSGLAIAAPFASTIKSASALQETMNKFDVVFGNNANTVKAWGDDFAGQVGRSKGQIAQFMAGSQDLFVPLGFDDAAATDVSKTITGLALDLASFNDMADTDVLANLHSALTGEGSVMKKYGVILNETTTQQELLNQSIDPRHATEQQKVQARLNIILKGTTAAQGDAIRSADGYANTLKRLEGTVDDAKASIGTALLPTVTKMVGWLEAGASKAEVWATNNAGLITTVATVAGGMMAAGVALLSVAFAAKVGALGLGLVAVAFKLVGAAALLATSPLTLTIAGIAGVSYAALEHFGKTEALARTLGDTWQTLKADAGTAFGGIKAALESGDLGAAAGIAGAFIELEWTRAVLAVTGLWEGFKEVYFAVVDSLAEKWQNFSNGLADILDVSLNAVLDTFDKTRTAIIVELVRVQHGDRAAAEAQEGLELADRINSRNRHDKTRENMAERKTGENTLRASQLADADKRKKEAAERIKVAETKVERAKTNLTTISRESEIKAEQEARTKAEERARSRLAAGKGEEAKPLAAQGSRPGAPQFGQFSGITSTSQSGVAGRLAYSLQLAGPSETENNPVPLLGDISGKLGEIGDILSSNYTNYA